MPAIVHSALEYYELLTDDLKQPPVAAAHMLQAQPQQQEQQVPAAAR